MRHIPCQNCRYEISVPEDETERFAICPACYMRQRIPSADLPPESSGSGLTAPPVHLSETEPESDIYDLQTGGVPKKIYKETIPVYCKLCHTLMYAAAENIGSFLTCPDCGVKTLVAHTPSGGGASPG